MTVLRRIGWLLTWCVASAGHLAFVLLAISLIVFWGLATRGVPLTVDIAQRLLQGQLTVEQAAGGWLGPITLDGVVLDTPSVRAEIDHVRLSWSPLALLQGRLLIDELEVSQVRVQQKPHPESPPEPLQTRLPIDLIVARAQLAGLEWQALDGAPVVLTQLSTRASWLGDQIKIDSLQVSHAETGAVQLAAQLRLAPRQIAIESLQLEGPATLTAQGQLGLLGQPSQLSAHLEQGRWPLQGAAQFRVPQLDATLHGVLSGAPLNLALTLKGALRTALDEQTLGFDLDGALALTEHGARIERLQVVSTDGAGRLSAEGEVTWQPALTIEATAEVRKLDPGILLPDWKGQLNGQLEASTQIVNKVPKVRFVATLGNSQLRGYPLRLKAQGTAILQDDTQQLRLDTLNLVSGNTTLKAEGDLLPQMDARASLNATDLNSLLPSLGGAIHLDASLQGAPDHPAIRAKGNARKLRYQDTQLADVQFDLDYLPGRDSHLKLLANGLVAGEMRMASASIEADGLPDRHTIKADVRLAEPQSSASLSLAGAVDLTQPRWQGELLQSSFVPPYGPAWQQEAAGALTLSATGQQLQPTCWHADSARLCLDATLASPSVRLAYRIEQLDTRAFAAVLPEGWAVQTVINGQGELALEGAQPQQLDVALQLSAGRIQLPGAPALQLQPSSLTVQQVGEQWQGKARLVVDHGLLSLAAAMPVKGGPALERPVSGTAEVDVPDLSWLNPALPDVQELKGSLAGQFSLAGQLGAPRLEGSLVLRDGSAYIKAAGVTVSQITATVQGGNTGPLQIKGSARSGGILSLDGQADFANGTPVVRLEIKGSEVQVADIADARVWVSPDLRYSQTAEGMKLTGSVQVPKAEITPRRLAANAVGASADQVLVGAEAPETKPLSLTAEVDVVLGKAVTFEGFGLKSKITGHVLAIDRPGGGGTRGRGELELVNAVYKAYGQEINVETGHILFNGGPIAEPTIDLVARRNPREGVSVSLHVRGTLDQPTFDLSSSPAMPREQQLGWLLFGQPIDSGSGEFSGAAAALSLGIAGGDALASRIGKIIGLDQVSLAADPSSTAWQSSNTQPGVAGTDQTRFTVGKYLSPKLFVSYGVGLFDNGNVLRLLYDLGRGFKLRTETGLETGGDLLYSVEH